MLVAGTGTIWHFSSCVFINLTSFDIVILKSKTFLCCVVVVLLKVVPVCSDCVLFALVSVVSAHPQQCRFRMLNCTGAPEMVPGLAAIATLASLDNEVMLSAMWAVNGRMLENAPGEIGYPFQIRSGCLSLCDLGSVCLGLLCHLVFRCVCVCVEV